MKSLERRFNNISTKNPYLSSYLCFVVAVRDQNFSKKIIAFWFNKLVEKDDYSKQDKKELIGQLNLLSNFSNTPEGGIK